MSAEGMVDSDLLARVREESKIHLADAETSRLELQAADAQVSCILEQLAVVKRVRDM
jgi:hypothetical protein